MDKSKFKVWEILLVFFTLILLVLLSYIYIIEFPIRNYIFDLPDKTSKVVIGKIASQVGSIRRQVLNEAEFKSIHEKSDLFNLDTIVTGDESKAKLNFEDGSFVELGANTMIRLSFLKNVSYKGFEKIGKVEVITGQIKGSAGKNKLVLKTNEGVVEIKSHSTEVIKTKKIIPISVAIPVNIQPVSNKPYLEQATPTPLIGVSSSPTPTPTFSPLSINKVFTEEEAEQTKVLEVIINDDIKIINENSQLIKQVTLKWKHSNSVDGKILIQAFKLKSLSSSSEDIDIKSRVQKKLILSKIGKTVNSLGQLNFFVKEPGHYEWKISDLKNKPITSAENSKSRFYVKPEFLGIKVLHPLVANEEMESTSLTKNILKEADFGIKLRWEKYPGATKYNLWLGKSSDAKEALLNKDVEAEEYELSKYKIFVGEFYYKIQVLMDSGFIATSGIQKFNFNFSPPVPNLPLDDSTFKLTQTKKILITWQKTNFTQGYELEVSITPDFSSLYFNKKTKINVAFVPTPTPGKYWWRVKGFSKNLISLPSPIRSFTIAP